MKKMVNELYDFLLGFSIIGIASFPFTFFISAVVGKSFRIQDLTPGCFYFHLAFLFLIFILSKLDSHKKSNSNLKAQPMYSPISPKPTSNAPSYIADAITPIKSSETRRIDISRDSELEHQVLLGCLQKVLQENLIGIDSAISESLEVIAKKRPNSWKNLSKLKGFSMPLNSVSKNLFFELSMFETCTNHLFYGNKYVSDNHFKIKAAIDGMERLQIVYKGNQRNVSPIFFNASYFWARCELRNNELRSFRIDRIEAIVTKGKIRSA